MTRERFSTFDERSTETDPLFGPPTSSERRRLKSHARSSDRAYASAYDEGRKNGRRETRSAHPSRGSRLRRPVRTGARRGVGQVEAPVVAQVASATKLAGMTFIVIALYLFLENATATAGALGAVARAVEWVKAPNKSVPYVGKG